MSLADLITLVPELQRLLRCGIVAWESAPYVEGVSAAILEASRTWDPKVRGIAILEDERTRIAGAGFLAGMVCTLKRHGFTG